MAGAARPRRAAVKALRKRGLEAEGEVVGTRKAAARICQQARALDCDVIVMAADPPRNRVAADFMWTQEPYRVRRKAKVPVYLVVDPGSSRRLATLRAEARDALLRERDDAERLAQFAARDRRQLLGVDHVVDLADVAPASICVAWCWRRTLMTMPKPR